MKKITLLVLSAALVAAAACSVKEDPIIEETPVQGSKVYTLVTTLSPANNPETRSIMTDNGSTVSTDWQVGDKIWVNYDNTSDENCLAKGIVTAVDGSGKATVTADLIDPKDASIVVFGFPYDHWTEAKDVRVDQVGTLEDINLNHAAISGSGTLTVSGSDVTLPTGVSMNPDLCIWKLNFATGSDITSQITSLNISFGPYDDYMITPNSLSNIYVALYPEDSANITIKAATASGNYTYAKSGVTLVAGKFYRSAVVLAPAAASDTYRVFTGRTTYTDETIPDGATSVTSGMTSWAAGTYVVSSDVTIDANVSCSGDINLILKDGASLTVNGTFIGADNLNIYGQELGTGSFTVLADDIDVSASNIIIHGGNIYVEGSGYTQCFECMNMDIYHGTVTAAGAMNGFMIMGNIRIFGGDVMASTTMGAALQIYGSGTPGSLTVSGGTFTALGIGSGSYNKAILVEEGYGAGTSSVTFTGGTIRLRGGMSDGSNRGADAIDVQGTLTISGNAVVSTVGGPDVSGKGGGYGINVREGSSAGGSAIFSGGTITARGGDQMAAIYIQNDLTISGATTEIDAGGGKNMEGILAGGIITINSGKVTANGGDEGGIGLEGNTFINGGLVTAIGGNGVISSMENGAAGFDGTLSVTGGKLIATGGAKAGSGTDGLGISDGSTITLTGVTLYEGDDADPTTPAADQSTCTKRYAIIK